MDITTFCSWLSLSRPRLYRITAYLEVKIWSLPRHDNLTTGKKNIVEKRRNCSWGAISPLFHNIFNIFLNSRVILHIYFWKYIYLWLFELFVSSVLQIWYVEVRISRSISESPLEFEITRVDCILNNMFYTAETRNFSTSSNIFCSWAMHSSISYLLNLETPTPIPN